MPLSENVFNQHTFQFGNTKVQILRGDILRPGIPVDALVSTDDNYLTMGAGLARALAKRAGVYYVRAAQKQAPVKAGSVVVTGAYRLSKHGLDLKCVLHGTVVDYDTYDSSLEELVYRATTNCLELAQERGLSSLVFPAFATGSGGLPMGNCARQMCSAIKAFLAQEHLLEAIYIMLYVPLEEDGTLPPDKVAESEPLYRPFFQAANLVLGTPYNPISGVRQSRSFYGRQEEIARLQALLSVQGEDDQAKRHAMILGGPAIGKGTLLDKLFALARNPESGRRAGQAVARLEIGRVHKDTPPSFVYRRFLSAMAETEQDEVLRKSLTRASADSDMDCDRFLAFLKDRYQEVVLLVDHLPRLLEMDRDEDLLESPDSFWKDLDKLQVHVRFVFTARDQDCQKLIQTRLEPLTQTFKRKIEVIRLACLKESERRVWVDALFANHLACPEGAHEDVHAFFEREAGLHPALIALLGHALVTAIKRDAIYGLETQPQFYTEEALRPLAGQALESIESPRRQLFDRLLSACNADEQAALRNLAMAEARQREIAALTKAMPDPGAIARFRELQTEPDPRARLQAQDLETLQDQGMLVHADNAATAAFMAPSFGTYVARFFGVGAPDPADTRPRDVAITLLRPKPNEIAALFRGTGATVDMARKELTEDQERDFLQALYACIRHWRDRVKYPEGGPFQNPEEAGNLILTQFTTGAIRGYLQDLPKGSTISLAVVDALKDIPWELMLEPAYAGEIRFQIGRSVIGTEPTRFGPPAGRGEKIGALLIADPQDNLPVAVTEVEELAVMLKNSGHFDPVVERKGKDATPFRLLADMGSGQYGLIHYSGHSEYDRSQSAWLLAGDKRITTAQLTAALQNGSPALVVSSSCESAKSGASGPAYFEYQTFDLVSAFLAAGTQAYVGTLWKVESSAAKAFSLALYEALLQGESLGECVRLAKGATKQHESSARPPHDDWPLINWLAFVLYGNPHTRPGDLFPALKDS